MNRESLANKSIALIIPDFDFGGEEKRVVFFANNFVNYFENVFVIAPHGKSLELLNKDVKFIQLSVRSFFNVFEVVKLIKVNKINFVQGHKRATLLYLKTVELFCGIKCVFNFDNIYLNNNNITRLLVPRYLVYLSDIMREFYAPIYNNSTNLTINMGGDFYEKANQTDVNRIKYDLNIQKELIILSLGRLSPQKNHEFLFKALAKIEKINFKCLVAGEGELEIYLKEVVCELGLQNKVIFLGHRTDIQLLLSTADVLIQSSLFEGFPNVFIEAASLGLPIISTNVGSAGILVKENGILIESRNLRALVNSILEFEQNIVSFKKEAIKFSRSNFFLQFHRSKMLENYLNLYTKLLITNYDN